MRNVPLNTDTAASMLGISPTTLRIWRVQGKGPRFTKLGTTKQSGVVYFEEDITAWLEQHKFASTSAYSKYPNCTPNDASLCK